MAGLELCPLVLKNEKLQNHTEKFKFIGCLPASWPGVLLRLAFTLVFGNLIPQGKNSKGVSAREPSEAASVQTGGEDEGVHPEETEGRLSQAPLFSRLQHTKALWGPAEGHPGSGFCHCFLILARVGAGQKGNPLNKETEESQRPPREKLQLVQQLLYCTGR